ncbi:MAG: DUF421 domain-containing protein [Faecalibacterium sp.]|nr:DUF421 domain-containing protein [Faecalibacterium sp.]
MSVLVLRTVVIYLSVLFSMRIMGKRQLGELQPGELVSTILISNLASISIESIDVPITYSLLPLFLITGIELISSAISLKSRRFALLVQGQPKTVIRDGQIDLNTLKKLRVSTPDLLSALRAKDIFDPRQVSCAIIETNGSLSVAKKPEEETVTLQNLSLSAASTKAFVPFVLEGKVNRQNLQWCGKSEDWLRKQLTDRVTPLCDVIAFLGNDTDECYLVRVPQQEGHE